MIGSSPSTPCHCGGRSTTCCRSRRIAMTETSRTYTTKTGRELTDSDIEKLADEAEQGYDVDDLRRRRRGRPMLGSAPAEVVPVRLDPELKRSEEHTSELQSLMRNSYAVFCLYKKLLSPQKYTRVIDPTP